MQCSNVWQNYFISFLNSNIKTEQLKLRFDCLGKLLSAVEQAVLICSGIYLIQLNQLTTGQLIAFLVFRYHVHNKANSFLSSMCTYRILRTHCDRLSDIVSQEKEAIDSVVPVRLPEVAHLQLRNVGYRHSVESNFIFRGIDLDISQHEKVALVGPSGIGKTTLLKIMMGLLSYQEGEIFFGGYAIKKIGLRRYRKILSSVLQEDTLFSGTVLDNISFFSSDVDWLSIVESAELAEIHDEIMLLPMGYYTLIGSHGMQFSGGQKQRVLLARALYKKPKMLFLDEATSHLDTTTELQINKNLQKLPITQVIVAHRRETIALADRIVDVKELINSAAVPGLI